MNKVIVFLWVMMTPGFAVAQTPEDKGLAIAKAADKRDSGFGDFTADAQMILRNRKGQESLRDLRIRTLEVQGDGDKSLSVFDRPRDIKKTAMLTFSHGLKPDDQWLYLPALKRVKRIHSRNKSGPFVGSEFAYEDLSSQEVEKYSYKYLREEACGEWLCHVIERIPAYEFSGYSRQIVWLDKDEYRVTKVEYYDRKNALLKTLSMAGYREYMVDSSRSGGNKGFWRPHEMFMRNHQTGKSTKLLRENYRFKTGLTTRDFNANTLSRVR